jgi:hypothetical protein
MAIYRFTRPVGSSVSLCPPEKDDDGRSLPPVEYGQARLKVEPDSVVPVLQNQVVERRGPRFAGKPPIEIFHAVYLAAKPETTPPPQAVLIVEV